MPRCRLRTAGSGGGQPQGIARDAVAVSDDTEARSGLLRDLFRAADSRSAISRSKPLNELSVVSLDHSSDVRGILGILYIIGGVLHGHPPAPMAPLIRNRSDPDA